MIEILYILGGIGYVTAIYAIVKVLTFNDRKAEPFSNAEQQDLFDRRGE